MSPENNPIPTTYYSSNPALRSVAGETETRWGSHDGEASSPMAARLSLPRASVGQSFSEEAMQERTIQELVVSRSRESKCVKQVTNLKQDLLSHSDGEAPNLATEVASEVPAYLCSQHTSPTSPAEIHTAQGQTDDVYQDMKMSFPHASASTAPKPLELAHPAQLAPFGDSKSFASSTPMISQHLQFWMQDSKGRLNHQNKHSLSLEHLKSLTLEEFFMLYSQRTNIPLADLTYLTFTFVSAKSEEIVVHRDNEAAWENLIDTTSVLFPLFKNRNPQDMKFMVSVEIGEISEMREDKIENDCKY